jgi:hypothetical protein
MKMLTTVCPALLAVAFAAACDKNAAPSGPDPEPVVARPTAEQGGKPAPANPHGDLGAAGNPHGDLGAAGTSHADPSGMPDDDIHAGMRMPQADFDPALALDGTIDVPAKLAGQVKAGDILFLFAKKIDPDTGKPFGGPVAVDRVDVTAMPVPFHLDGGNLMMQGTKFEGTVMLFARVDRDGEARTREKGDLEGTLQVTVPAKGLKIVLDTPVE